MVDVILINHLLKRMDNRISTDASLNGAKCFVTEIGYQFLLIIIMKSIHNFVGIAYKTIDGINRIPKAFIESFNTESERGAVLFSYQFTAFKTSFIIQVRHRHSRGH